MLFNFYFLFSAGIVDFLNEGWERKILIDSRDENYIKEMVIRITSCWDVFLSDHL